MEAVACVTEQMVRLPTCVISFWERSRCDIYRLAALLCLLSTLHFAFVVLPPAAAQNSPGIVADLYPAWYASRVVLIKHGDPYSPEATARIQAAMYEGRSASRNEQRFAYPIFAVLLFAPFAAMPFAWAQICFLLVATLLTVLSVFAWLGESLPQVDRITYAALVLAAFPVMLGLELRQPTMLVAALLAGMVACLRAGCLIPAGVLGAVALAKPQLAVGVLVPVFFWSLAAWPVRKTLWLTLGSTLGALLGVSEFVSRGWIVHWLATMRAYVHYAGAKPLICALPGSYLPPVAGALLLGASIAVFWKCGADDILFSIGLSVTVFHFLFPFQLYNEVMLLPAVLWALVRGPKPKRKLLSILRRLVWGVLIAGWLSTSSVCIAQAFSRPGITRIWSSPLLIDWLFPFVLLAYLTACASVRVSATVAANKASRIGTQVMEALGARNIS